ncbi:MULTISPECIES: DivIVA domain-containing protein [unclassified Isoptericola]|uniref:DivIVA domain-containing protein n=1 Tax=unclassified Isoptericola TaxID=2623355 RepID=UPI0036692294
MSTSLAEEILSKRFATTKLREGYDMSEVDDFLDTLVAAVKDGTDVAALVDGARFASTKFREGYDMTEVDDYLDEVKTRAAATATGSAGAAPSRPEQSPADTPSITSTAPDSTITSPTLPASTGGLRGWFTRRRD